MQLEFGRTVTVDVHDGGGRLVGVLPAAVEAARGGAALTGSSGGAWVIIALVETQIQIPQHTSCCGGGNYNNDSVVEPSLGNTLLLAI